MGGKRLAGDGNPLWSLTNTRHTAETLRRETGIGKVPEYIPRRIGEILGPFVLVGAALGGVLTLRWLRARALPGAIAGVVAVVVFAAFASVGLPIDTRYAFLPAAILCVFAGAAVCGWMELSREDPHRRWWMAAAAVVGGGAAGLDPIAISLQPSPTERTGSPAAHPERTHRAGGHGAIATNCEPIGVTNHAPVPLLALWLEAPPSTIANLQVTKIMRGTFVDPANAEVQKHYILDRNDPHQPVAVPSGFTVTHSNRSWRDLQRCR